MRRLKQRMSRVCSLLGKRFGSEPKWFGPGRADPLDVLVGVILSQNTSDANSNRAFAELKKRFPRWSRVLSAPLPKVVEAIRRGGLANVKARRIKEVLAEVKRRTGGLSLKQLTKMSSAAARKWLLSIKGIGPKSAAVVVAFGFGKPAMPLDTHCRRVLDRLGVISERLADERAHELAEQLVEDEAKLACHTNLILLGRTICRPGNPRCVECPLNSECGYFRKHFRRSRT